MALLKIISIPDPRLRVQTKPVVTIDEALQTTIDDMIETMYHANGVGLAATQVALDMQLTVIDCSEERNKPMVFINPEIVDMKDITEMDEGCLSVPGHFDRVKRARWVKATALDREGKPFTVEAEGLFAEAIQHEIDHLNGKLYIDQLSTFKQKRIQEKVRKYLNKQRKS